MRILVDARLPWGSGIGRYISNIVPRVAARMPRSQFTVLASISDAQRAEQILRSNDNIAVLPTAIAPFSLSEQFGLHRYARGYDLTWFTNYCVPLRWKGAFVTTVHDMIHCDPGFPAAHAKRFAARRTFMKVRRDSAHIIFVSRFTAREFERHIGKPDQASVVYHGIDHSGSHGIDMTSERTKTGLIVAAAKKHKNLLRIINAWNKAQLVGWTLTIVSPGDLLRSSIEIESHVAGRGNIELMHGISDTQLAALYARAGFVIVPSYYEGFGLPLLEAMRGGAPVISSTAEALVEVAAGSAIPFVNPEDDEGWISAILDMASNCGPSQCTDWRQQLVEHNRAIAAKFTWDEAALRTSQILRNAGGREDN